MKWKVCGMMDPGNVHEVAGMRPDYMGFIFYRQSPRYMEKTLGPEELPAGITRTGVFADALLWEILEAVGRYSLDAVQLHGSEKPELCALLRYKGLQVIKKIAVRPDQAQLPDLQRYEGCCTHFLFDTLAEFQGGNGIAFNWSVLQDYDLEIPFFLSGGIGPHNIGAALSFRHPQFYAVDVNSRCEVRPGIKDLRELMVVREAVEQFKTVLL